MNQKEFKRRMAYEVLIILGMLALLTFICRLWPILLLIILGIFIAAIRLLFLSSKKVEVIEPMPQAPEPVKEPTERDVRELAYAVILKRITELITDEYPDARWVWENPNAKQCIQNGEEVYVLLNRAGGYRRAKVVIANLQVLGIRKSNTIASVQIRIFPNAYRKRSTRTILIGSITGIVFRKWPRILSRSTWRKMRRLRNNDIL